MCFGKIGLHAAISNSRRRREEKGERREERGEHVGMTACMCLVRVVRI
jgi:hypothetical protein